MNASCFVVFLFSQAGGGSGGGAGGEAALLLEAKSIEDQLLAKGGPFDIEAITMQYPVVYEESMNTVSCLDDMESLPCFYINLLVMVV